MKLAIELVTPAERHSRSGNRVTALRWAMRLRELGHGVRVTTRWSGERRDLVVALHAVKSAGALESAARLAPTMRRVLALTGTDVYGEIESSAVALRSLELAERVIALQSLAAKRVPEPWRAKVRTIEQSAPE